MTRLVSCCRLPTASHERRSYNRNAGPNQNAPNGACDDFEKLNSNFRRAAPRTTACGSPYLPRGWCDACRAEGAARGSRSRSIIRTGWPSWQRKSRFAFLGLAQIADKTRLERTKHAPTIARPRMSLIAKNEPLKPPPLPQRTRLHSQRDVRNASALGESPGRRQLGFAAKSCSSSIYVSNSRNLRGETPNTPLNAREK